MKRCKESIHWSANSNSTQARGRASVEWALTGLISSSEFVLQWIGPYGEYNQNRRKKGIRQWLWLKEGIQRDEVQIKRRPLIKGYEEEYVREVQRLKTSIQFNSIQTVYFPEGAYNSNMAMDQRGRTMPKPFMSNNDILSVF